MNPLHLATLLAISSALSGCGLDALENKTSDFQRGVEYRAALTIPSPSLVASVAPVAAIATPEPVQIAEAPECSSDVFRVYRCSDGKITDWTY